MNIVLILLCLTVCFADFAQLLSAPVQPGPVVGVLLYVTLAFGVYFRMKAAYIVLAILPVIPLSALLLTMTGLLTLTTPWTGPISLIQLAAAVGAVVQLRRGVETGRGCLI